jgi:hypothetical protein
MKVLSLWLPLLLVAGLSAQRPNSPQEALLQFEDVRSEPERFRHRAVRDLGRFVDAGISRTLVAELERAETMSYRNTVVRAIGAKARDGVLPALVAHLAKTDAARLCGAIADAMRRQGPDGVQLLAQQLASHRNHKQRREAICYALGKVEKGDEARDLLLDEIRRSGGEARLAPLRGLAARHGDEAVDAVRVQLAGDKRKVLAGTALGQLARHGHDQAPRLAEQFARGIADDASGDLHAAVALGLLVGPSVDTRKLLWRSVARADAPFGDDALPRWRRALGQAGAVAMLFDGAVDHKQAAVRAAAARALGFTPASGRAEVYPMLQALLVDRDAGVVSAACAAVLQLADERADRALAAAWTQGAPALQALRTAALAERTPDDPGRFVDFARTAKGEAAAASLRLLARRFAAPAAAGEVARKRLGDRDWQVRVAAIELLRAERNAASVPLLIERLKKDRSRVRADLLAALQDLTGARFEEPKQWRAWWAAEQANFAVRPAAEPRKAGKPDATATTYWDIPVTSDRVTFVVDTSGSMLQPFGTGNALRIDEARRQLTQVFDRLPKGAKVDVIAFAADATAMFGKLTALGRSKRKAADGFVEALVAKGPTDVHEALRLAFASDDVDTIFLLTDGRPSVGAIVDFDRLAREVARWNVGRGVRIHTIAIGGKSDLLERLARDSGGEHAVAR